MMPSGRPFLSASLALLSLVAVPRASSDAAYVKQVDEWRHKHETDYTREYVPLSGLFFLKRGENRAGSAAGNDLQLPPSTPASFGTFTLAADDRVTFTPAPDADVRLKGHVVRNQIALVDDGGKDKPDELQVGTVSLWVHRSGDRRSIRMRDTNGPTAREFKGFNWFPIDPSYRVSAAFRKDPAPRKVLIPTILGDEEEYTTEGTVAFTLNGESVTMRPMTTKPGRLYFIFKDATSGKETYHTARFLYADLQPDGTTVLDFNEAYNPPCAFNPYTTCPLPPKENQLSVKILAGEKDYPH